MKENGYELDMTDARLYHEIYLSDLRKYDINRLKQLSDILLKRLDNLLKVKYMKEFLNEVRTPIKGIKTKDKIINTILIFLLGIILGIFSKWLDNLNINNTVWWQNIIDILDLRNVFYLFGIWIFIATTISIFSKTPIRASLNVFLFFIGMTVSYHLYTIYFSGFNPKNYMMIWYVITLISPILAYICWYAKGKGKISLLISSIIILAMLLSSFSIGIWYFDINSIIDLLLFIGTVLVLYMNPKKTIYSLTIATVLAYIVRTII